MATVHGLNKTLTMLHTENIRHPWRKLSMDHSKLCDYLGTEPCQKFTEEFNCYPCDWILLVPPHDRNSES